MKADGKNHAESSVSLGAKYWEEMEGADEKDIKHQSSNAMSFEASDAEAFSLWHALVLNTLIIHEDTQDPIRSTESAVRCALPSIEYPLRQLNITLELADLTSVFTLRASVKLLFWHFRILSLTQLNHNNRSVIFIHNLERLIKSFNFPFNIFYVY